MSLDLLKKSIALDDALDGVREKTKKNDRRATAVQQEREMLRNNQQHYDFDLQTGELRKKRPKDVKADPLVSKLSTKAAKQGYSLVDQFRDVLPKNVDKRNEKYLELTGRATVANDVTRQVTKQIVQQMGRKKQQATKRRDLRSLLGTKQKKKRKSKSVFSDADFSGLSSNTQSERLMDQFKKIR
ncbi:hypothetical protein M3Y99_00637500 [Aphelenchoides fujianensis]|nr:hypothetical protein M3Y99_00637500 [Aphelenchoides fujianensis]